MQIPTPPESGSSSDWKKIACSAVLFVGFVGFAGALVHGSKFLSKEFIYRPALYQSGMRGLLESIPLVGIVFERSGWAAVGGTAASGTTNADDGFNG